MTKNEFINHIKTTDATDTEWYLFNEGETRPCQSELDLGALKFRDIVSILDNQDDDPIYVGYHVCCREYNIFKIEKN